MDDVRRNSQLREHLEKMVDRLALIIKSDRRIKLPKHWEESANFKLAARRLSHEIYKNFHDDDPSPELANAFENFYKYIEPYTTDNKIDWLKSYTDGSSYFFSVIRAATSLNLYLKTGGALPDNDIEITGVPTQSPSPIYVRINENRLTLDTGRHLHPLLRPDAISQTRAYLESELSVIEQSLETSNVDRRFTQAFSRLRDLLRFEDDAGAINLGLHTRTVALMLVKVENEIADILVAQISSSLTTLSHFAAQYKDWIDFIRNAQQYPARDGVDVAIEPSIARVVETMQGKQESVDERIPVSFRMLQKLLEGDKTDRTNAIYAAVRGFENVCIAAVRFAYDQTVELLKDAGKKARPTLVALAAVGIVAVTLKIVADFLPVIRNAPELNWILENLSRIEKIGEILKRLGG